MHHRHHTPQHTVAATHSHGDDRDHHHHHHHHHHHATMAPPPAASTTPSTPTAAAAVPRHLYSDHPLMCAPAGAGPHLSPLGNAPVDPRPAAADPSTESIRAAWESAGVLHLHAPSRPRYVFIVQAARVARLPAAPDFGCLMLCPAYDHGLLAGSAAGTDSKPSAPGNHHTNANNDADDDDNDEPFCPHGDACPYVHADLTGARRTAPHTMAAAVAGFYAMAASSSCTPSSAFAAAGKGAAALPAASLIPLDTRLLLDKQERHEEARHPHRAAGEAPCPAADVRRLAATLAQGVPAHRIVATRAALAPTPASPHQPIACPHFATRFRCDRGDRCKFAHVIVAGPSDLGPHGRGAVAAAVKQQLVVPGPQGAGDRDCDAATPRSADARSGGSSACGSRRSTAAASSSAGSSVGRRWRHNPYAALPRVASRG